MNGFQVASASILGRDHVGTGKNNQDALCVLRGGDEDRLVDSHLIAVVCDGCGSGAYSEFGARLGASVVANALRQELVLADRYGRHAASEVMRRVRDSVLTYLRLVVLAAVGPDRAAQAQFVQDHLLFTVVGAFVNTRVVWTFSLGDGVVYRNGDRITLEKNEGNAPAYLSYALIPGAAPQGGLDFVVHDAMSSEVSSVLIGTDGVEALVAAAEQRMPGRQELVGPIERLWTEDRFFTNKDALRRHLTLVNRDHQQIDWKRQVVDREHGPLKDDTTLVVIRRSS